MAPAQYEMKEQYRSGMHEDSEDGRDETAFSAIKLNGEDEFYGGVADVYRRKKKEKKKRRKGDAKGEDGLPSRREHVPGGSPPGSGSASSRKIVNLPASQPYVKIMDGEERLCFKYNTKISESALSTMPKAELEESEFAVRFDLESVDISKLNEKFKADNCVYPRANIPYEMYMGNRWNYETECNKLAWQFVSLNPVLLYGKKGLIQRAVDSYRNITKTRQGQRLYGAYGKDDTFAGDIERRRRAAPALSNVQISWVSRGLTKRVKIQTGVEHVDYDGIPAEFRMKYAVLNEQFDAASFGRQHWEPKNEDNILAVKIAFLNVENTSFLNAVKAIGLYAVLKKVVDVYKSKKEEVDEALEGGGIDGDDEKEAYEVVSETLNRALSDVSGKDGFSGGFSFGMAS